MGRRMVKMGCPDCKHQSAGPLRMAGSPCERCSGWIRAFVAPTPGAPGAWVSGDDVRRVMHTLGMRGIDRRRWGYRNHYAPGERDADSMRRLVDAGLMEPGAPYRATRFHHATPLAGELLGFGRTLMRRAFGGGA